MQEIAIELKWLKMISCVCFYFELISMSGCMQFPHVSIGQLHLAGSATSQVTSTDRYIKYFKLLSISNKLRKC